MNLTIPVLATRVDNRTVTTQYKGVTIRMTRNEAQVLQFIAMGYTHVAGAVACGIGQHNFAVRSHRALQRIKLRCNTRLAGVALACHFCYMTGLVDMQTLKSLSFDTNKEGEALA